MSAVANLHSGVGSGRKRKTYLIKEWMDAQEILQADVAQRAGIKGHSVVSRTIRGGANNKKVLKALKDLGCPEGYLALPEEMKTKQAL